MTASQPAGSHPHRRNRALIIAVAAIAVAWFLFEISGLFATPTERYINRIEGATGCSTIKTIEAEALRDLEVSDAWADIEAAAARRWEELGCLGLEL